MHDAIILGGGISGLTTAYLLQREGLDVAIIEKSPQPGGPILSERAEGYLFEKGPNSLLLPDPWVETLIEELGLQSRQQESSPAAHKRYIVKRGRPVPVPMSPTEAIFTPLFSWRGKFGFLAEPFRPRISDLRGAQETVASFVERRMGRDFLDYAIDPFVSGVYAGDPRQLVLEHAFPLMRGFERDGGSIIRGALRRRQQQKAAGTAYKKRSVSFDDGLGILPATLARKLGNRLWLGSQAAAINRNDAGWQVSWKRGGESFEGFARHLVVCLPAHATKRLAWSAPFAAKLAAPPELAYPAVHSLALGFRRSDVAHPLDGFGMLVPSKEKSDILGALFSSALYPGRAPQDHCLLTVMLGGVRRPDLAHAAPERLLELALPELRSLLGLRGDPTFVRCSSWPKAIPQYTHDFSPWRDTLKGLEDDFPSLHFGGSAIDGIAMGAAILSGKRIATRIAADRE